MICRANACAMPHDLGGEAVVLDLHLAEPPAGQADHA